MKNRRIAGQIPYPVGGRTRFRFFRLLVFIGIRVRGTTARRWLQDSGKPREDPFGE